MPVLKAKNKAYSSFFTALYLHIELASSFLSAVAVFNYLILLTCFYYFL